jgi:hypothetical protein
MDKKTLWIAAGVAVAWFFFRKSKAGAAVDRVVYSYGGTLVSPEQAKMLAEQDAAFASGDSFIDAPFHA